MTDLTKTYLMRSAGLQPRSRTPCGSVVHFHLKRRNKSVRYAGSRRPKMLLQLDLQDLRLVRRKPVRRNAEISGKNLAPAGDDSAVALGALGTNGSHHHGRLDRCDRAEPCYFCRRLCSMVRQETGAGLMSSKTAKLPAPHGSTNGVSAKIAADCSKIQ
jgi:hypothetical protein